MNKKSNLTRAFVLKASIAVLAIASLGGCVDDINIEVDGLEENRVLKEGKRKLSEKLRLSKESLPLSYEILEDYKTGIDWENVNNMEAADFMKTFLACYEAIRIATAVAQQPVSLENNITLKSEMDNYREACKPLMPSI